MRSSIDFYDDDPEGYSDKTFGADVSPIRDRFLRYVPEGGRILDLGCGSGRDTLYFSGIGLVPVPVDGSEGMCRIAERNTGIKVRRLLFADLDYQEEFDAVWACSTLLHVPSAEFPDVLMKVKRAMKDGAVLFMSFKEGDFEGEREGRMYTDMTEGRVRRLCESCRLVVLESWSSLEPGRDVLWRNTIVRKRRARTAKVVIGERILRRMAYDGRMGIEDIVDEEKTVYFDTYKLKKMTGTRIGPILGESEFSSPFKVACEIAGLYPGDKANKYIEAGNILEPVLRDYLASRANAMLKGPLGIPDGSVAAIEDPVPMEMCGYDHFHNEKLFGGLVDGYIRVDNVRDTILEIKTSGVKEKWEDGNGGYTNVPMSYMYQASLYAELSNLDRIVFLVGFLEEDDYDRPKQWVPTEENTYVIVKDKLDMKPVMEKCTAWYNEYMKNGYTPEWTDSECDQEVLKYLKAFKRKKR